MTEIISQSVQWFSNLTDQEIVKMNGHTLNANLRALQRDAISIGFSPNEMSIILHQLPKFTARPKACISIFRFLIPNKTIPIRSMIKILFWFNRLSLQEHSEIMIAIIKWIIVVFPYMEEPYQFNGYYDLLMRYIYSDTLQGYICHLLAFMTHSDDINAVRLTQLMKRSLNTQTISKEFIGLLGIYKLFQTPCNVVDSFHIPNDSFWFDSPDPMLWFYIQRVHIHRCKKEKTQSLLIFAQRPLYLLTQKERRFIPENLYKYFNKPTIEYESPLGIQLATMIFSKQSNFQYILYWIDHTINANYLKMEKGSFDYKNNNKWFGWRSASTLPFLPVTTPSILLQALIEISDFLNTGVVTIDKYISFNLPLPSDHKSDRNLLQLVPYLDIANLCNFKNHLFTSLSLCIHSNKEENDDLIFDYFFSFSKMLDNFLRRGQKQHIFLETSNFLSASLGFEENSHILKNLIENIFELFYELASLEKLNVKICTGMLLFLNTVASIPIKHHIPILLFPNKKLIYTLFMQSSPVILEGLLNCLSHYFLSYTEIECQFPSIYFELQVQSSVVEFNEILRQICNFLKYIRDKNDEIPSAIENEMFKVPEIVKDRFELKHCEKSLLICNHWAFIGCVLLYFKKSQPDVPSTELYHPILLLKDEKRFKEFSNFLTDYCGMKGVIRFLKLVTENNNNNNDNNSNNNNNNNNNKNITFNF